MDSFLGLSTWQAIALWAPFVVLIVITLGVVWAPFAALICGIIAAVRGSNPFSYAIAGAVHSALFILPWFYLVARMFGLSIPWPMTALATIVVYAAWIALSLTFFLGVPAIGIFIGLMILLTFLPTLREIFQGGEFARPDWQAQDNSSALYESANIFPPPVYLLPSAGLVVTELLFPVVLFLTSP